MLVCPETITHLVIKLTITKWFIYYISKCTECSFRTGIIRTSLNLLYWTTIKLLNVQIHIKYIKLWPAPKRRHLQEYTCLNWLIHRTVGISMVHRLHNSNLSTVCECTEESKPCSWLRKWYYRPCWYYWPFN